MAIVWLFFYSYIKSILKYTQEIKFEGLHEQIFIIGYLYLMINPSISYGLPPRPNSIEEIPIV